MNYAFWEYCFFSGILMYMSPIKVKTMLAVFIQLCLDYFAIIPNTQIHS